MRRSLQFASMLLVALATVARAEAPQELAIDELLFRATRYGNTEQKRAEKEEAREKLFAMGADGLRAVLERAHIENTMLGVLAHELVMAKVPAEEGVPVLMGYLTSDRHETRRFAAFLLGFYPAPRGGATKLLPLLEDERTRNAAIRTLGTWRAASAREPIGLLATSTNERTRIVVANALRDIGDPDDIPLLIEMLGDPLFTVRNTAARAIAAYGWSARSLLLRELDAEIPVVARRQVIRLLGELRIRTAARRLRPLIEHEDPGIRMDAAWALRQIDSSFAARSGADAVAPRLVVDPTPAQ